MDSSWDTIIVGAGIAGACAAVYCSARGRTLIIERARPASGASGVAAGLVNPFMGRRARPVWQRSRAIDALEETLERGSAAGFYEKRGVLRIPRDSSYVDTYRARSREFSAATAWLGPDAAAEEYPDLRAPHGALYVRTGGFVYVPEAITQMLSAVTQDDAELLAPARVTGWGVEDERPYVLVDHHTRLSADHIVLAPGATAGEFPELEPLDLRGVKGQTVRCRKPAGFDDLPPVSGYGYMAPCGDEVILGSTYEHDYQDVQPSRSTSYDIVEKVSAMIPALADAQILREQAGVRVMTPQTHKAMIGPIPGHERIWFFGGLGSKGLLMAPMMARRLPHWLDEPDTIPDPLRTNSTRTTQ